METPMWSQTVRKSLTARSTRRQPSRRRPPVSRLCLGSLEDRCLMSFGAAVTYPAGQIPEAVQTADVNGDGRLDLVVANSKSNSVSVLLGNPDGTFQPARNPATGIRPVSIA